MKRHDRTLVAAMLVACALLVSACTSSGSDASPSDGIPTATVVESDPAATATSESTDVSAVSDDELIAAALAAYEADPQPEGTIAWDVLDSSVFEEIVSFTMCTWDGIVATDVIRDVKFVTTIDDDGNINGRNVQSSPTSGDCLNTQLIESAIATANFHEEFWASITLDPASFAENETAVGLFTEFGFTNFETLTEQWIADGVVLRGTNAGEIPDDLLAPVAFRSYRDAEGQSLLEIVSCVAMDPEYGLYRGDALLDDFRSESSSGLHDISFYRLKPDTSAAEGWRIDGTDGRVWGDCFNTGDWIDAVNQWKPDPGPWEALEDG